MVEGVNANSNSDIAADVVNGIVTDAVAVGSDIVHDMASGKEVFWLNDKLESVVPMSEMAGRKFVYIRAAQNRLLRFMPYIEKVFPETAGRKGIIESELLVIPEFSDEIKRRNPDFAGRILLKDDAHLPIAGSVKARGGIYEVMVHAESLAMKAGLLKATDNYGKLDSAECRELFAKHTIQVGSTGNLGLSIGIMSSKLGFNTIVHMSADAKAWKKELLRKNGVTVVEYEGDYSSAVAQGRKLSAENNMSYFIDDENSEDLFLGYATAALRLKVQLFKAGIPVDETHPLFVYLPCGVGGAPGGITYGLKQIFGDCVHCFFAEPVGAPCFTLGMATGRKSDISIYDIGLDGVTIADGLAVGRASELVCEAMESLVSGSFTVCEDKLTEYMRLMYQKEDVFLEPSACAGIQGLLLQSGEKMKDYIRKHELTDCMVDSTHLVWATGGGLVPDEVRADMLGLTQKDM